MADDDYLKPILDLAAAVGTKGALSAMRMPEKVLQPVHDVVSAGDMATGKIPYDQQQAIELATRLAGYANTGAMAGSAPEGALNAGLARPSGRMTGYHLSPHEFDSFSRGAASGTGAQVEGAGTYLASHPEGAQMWESAMSPGPKHMYEVSINADPAHFMDRNAPFGQQAANVREALDRLGVPQTTWGRRGGREMDVPTTGASAYDYLRNMHGAEKASQMLNEAGVPGMRYPGANDGHNYVVYDPSVLSVLDKQRKYAAGGHIPYRLPLTSDDPNDVMRRAITYAFAVARLYGKADGGSVDPEIEGYAGGGALKKALQAAKGIIAYHGSPHSFDRFDLSKIGTGEGAQAYGHGLYFADSEDVARGYRDRIAGAQYVDSRGVPMQPNQVAEEIISTARKNGMGLLDAEDLGSGWSQYLNNPDAAPAPVADVLKKYGLGTRSNGSMYQVRINADPAHFLDWDKPLSEQSPVVSGYLHKHGLVNFEDNVGPSSTGEIKPLGWTQNAHSLTGENFYRRLTEGKFTPEMFTQGVPKGAAQGDVSSTLNAAGIPGIKYLDQGSRGAGDGSRNYVVFDDKLIDILKKYASGGEVDMIQDKYPPHYLPGVGRQVMADGGTPSYSAPITGQHTITLDDLIGRAPAPTGPTPGAYTDVGGQKIAAPFVTSMANGYPVYSFAPVVDQSSEPMDRYHHIYDRDGYKQGGSPSDIDNAVRAVKEVADREAMSHQEGFSGNVEFAPVRLREPLTGYEMPLGSVPKESAAVINPALDTAERFAPYAFGPAVGGAYDMAVGAKEGSMFDVATGAMGLPGRAMKAAGILGSTLVGGEAEAGPYTNFLKGVVERMRPHYDPSAMVKGMPDKKWLSEVALSRPLDQMKVKKVDERELIPHQLLDPTELEGKALITGMGDRTPAGYKVVEINGRKLTVPVDMQGGAAFSQDIAAQHDDPAFWASNSGRATDLANRIVRAAAQGNDPVFTYVAQGPQSGDFSHMMLDTVLGQLRRNKMDKGLVEKFDKVMREKQTASGKPFEPAPDWPGITSKNLRDILLNDSRGGAWRTKMTKLMDAAAYRDAPGWADVGAARAATTHPDLVTDPTFSAGYMFARPDPSGRLLRDHEVGHTSYDTLLASADKKPGYIGGLEYPLPPEVHFKNYLENEIDPSLRGKPFSQQTMSLRMSSPTVMATPEWTDMASEYQDLMRQEYGRRFQKP